MATMAKQKLSMDIPTNPTFSIPSIGQSVLDPIKFDFVLLNMNNNALKKNFEFLHALFAGTQWLQFPGGTIKSTNVYNVYCPGRFHIFWAALDMSVEADGKLRLCSKIAEDHNQIKSIDKDTLWPEVWKVSIQIKSLTPHNFNAYIHHFVHGFAEGTVKLLAGNYREQNMNLIVESNDPVKESSANGSLNLGLTKEERADFMATVKANSERTLADRTADLRKEIVSTLAEIKKKQYTGPNGSVFRQTDIGYQVYKWESVGGNISELGIIRKRIGGTNDNPIYSYEFKK